MNITENEYTLLRDFIYHKTGIFFEDSKKYMIERRLSRRMEELGCNTIRDYYYLLKSDTRGGEITRFINIITTNETYFFRNLPQIKLFSEELLPRIIEEKQKQKNYSLKIWSTACSTGDEPYTLAMLSLENIPDKEKWSLQILGSDINREVLERARKGTYGKRALKDVHDYYVEKYFTSTNGSGNYEIKPFLKNYVKFFYMNLVDEKRMRTITNVDIVFCRNVLIYFDDDSRKKTVELLYDSLVKEGYIFLGHSESMSRISSSYKPVKFNNGIIYQKK